MLKLTNELLNRRSLTNKMADKGIKLRHSNNVTITYWKSIHVRIDAAVTVKTVKWYSRISLLSFVERFSCAFSSALPKLK